MTARPRAFKVSRNGAAPQSPHWSELDQLRLSRSRATSLPIVSSALIVRLSGRRAGLGGAKKLIMIAIGATLNTGLPFAR